jgi:hypothetical protein
MNQKIGCCLRYKRIICGCLRCRKLIRRPQLVELRKRKIRQADRKEVIGWAIKDVPTGQKWEFSEDTSWETFKKTVSFKEGLWLWYDVTGANGKSIISAEDEFDTMRKLAISSWAGRKEYTRIHL